MEKIESISFGNMRVKVKDFNPNETIKIPEMVLNKINRFVKSHSKFTPVSDLVKECKIPKAFFEAHHVCMNCGDVQEKATYAIAQNAMGKKVTYTCNCGHKTILPQL